CVDEDRRGSRADLCCLLALDLQAVRLKLGVPKIAESVMLDHDDALVPATPRRRHTSKATTERLLRKDSRGRRVAAETDDDADIAYIPALAQHQHADDGVDLARIRINLSRSRADLWQFLVADLSV